MKKSDRYKGVIEWFKENMPSAETELQYKNPYQLLVAVILSAQCTDKRVNMTTPALLDRFPTPQSMADAEAEDIYPYIRSISYPNSKAKNLASMAKKLVSDFNGEVPEDIDLLQTLPGVGQKTANVIGSVIFGKQVMAVDTHVFRVSARIGLTVNAKNPLQTERQLNENIPAELRLLAHHWLILHGRYICVTRKPKCTECGIKKWCKYYADNQKNLSNGK